RKTIKIKTLHHISGRVTKETEGEWLLQQIAATFRIFAKFGFVDGSSGHITLRAVRFTLLEVSDMVRVDEKGNRVGEADKPVNAASFMICSAIHQKRPDIYAACHMHSPYGRAWSTFGKGIDMLSQGNFKVFLRSQHRFMHVLWRSLVYPAFGGNLFTLAESQRMTEYLGPTNKILIMHNHDLLTSGGTVAEAAAFFIALERASQIQLLVKFFHCAWFRGQCFGNIEKDNC
ncbi:hypothetical protein N7451_003494, partial [Penicillium sp. IBT 35674x]